MTYRDRFEAAMRHERVDRAPFDLSGTPMSLILSDRLKGDLLQLLGVSSEEALLRALDIDFRRVGGMPESAGLSRDLGPGHSIDQWGIERARIGSDWQIVKNPLAGATIADLDAYPWPDASKIDVRVLDIWRDEARRLFEETEYVVSCEHPVLGVLELGCWMCGFDDFLYRLAGEPEFALRFFERVWAYQRDVIDLYYGRLGPYIHLTTSGDDFGTQNAPFLSPAMFSEMVAPFYDRRIALTKQYTKARYFHHTCGSVYSLIPRLIDSGVEILNPIQPNARDMEPEKLRDAYGANLTFWGGVDTQRILPEGTSSDVRAHVRALCATFGKGGGFVLAPAHCLQDDVRAENVLALFAAGREYYGT